MGYFSMILNLLFMCSYSTMDRVNFDKVAAIKDPLIAKVKYEFSSELCLLMLTLLKKKNTQGMYVCHLELMFL